jgi:hypothetical protein
MGFLQRPGVICSESLRLFGVMVVSTKEFAANVYYFSELLLCLAPITKLFAWGNHPTCKWGVGFLLTQVINHYDAIEFIDADTYNKHTRVLSKWAAGAFVAASHLN